MQLKKKISIIITQTLSAILALGGIVVIAVGLFGFKEIVWGHVIFGYVTFLGGCAIFFYGEARDSVHYDEIAHRFYRYVERRDSPHHAPCPHCNTLSQMIITTTNKHHHGVWCDECRREVWFDKEKKK